MEKQALFSTLLGNTPPSMAENVIIGGSDLNLLQTSKPTSSAVALNNSSLPMDSSQETYNANGKYSFHHYNPHPTITQAIHGLKIVPEAVPVVSYEVPLQKAYYSQNPVPFDYTATNQLLQFPYSYPHDIYSIGDGQEKSFNS